jgi:hypothetical protein
MITISLYKTGLELAWDATGRSSQIYPVGELMLEDGGVDVEVVQLTERRHSHETHRRLYFITQDCIKC